MVSYADPPKAIADVVESLFGAIYTDSGLSQGMTAVSNMLGPMYNALLQFERENKEIRLTHPKKALQEMVGEVLSLDTSFENDFARQQSSTVVLDGKVWRMADPLSSNVVGSIHLMECTLVAVSNFSATVARNQACALIVQALQRNPGILQRLKDFRQRVEFILASKAHTIRKSNDDDDDDDNMNLVVASL